MLEAAREDRKPWVGLVLELVRVIVATLAGFFGGGGL